MIPRTDRNYFFFLFTPSLFPHSGRAPEGVFFKKSIGVVLPTKSRYPVYQKKTPFSTWIFPRESLSM